MKIAITVWGNRISPVFDSAQALLVAEIKQTEIVGRQIEMFQAGKFSRLIDLLEELKIKILICGALSDESAILLDSSGIEVIPFMTGEAESILFLYAKGMDLTNCIMPGCPQKRCCGARRCTIGKRRIRWAGCSKKNT